MQELKAKRTKALMHRKKKARNLMRARRDRRPIHLRLQKRAQKQGASPPAPLALEPAIMVTVGSRNTIEDTSKIESGVRKAEKKATTASMSPLRLRTIPPTAKRWTKYWVSVEA